MKFTKEMIEKLRQTYSKIETMDPESVAYKGICKALDNSSDEALKQMSEANIKFLSLLAVNRLIRRGVK